MLRAEGWRVLRFWEHEDPDAVADAICAALGRTSSVPDGSAVGRAVGAVGAVDGDPGPGREACGGQQRRDVDVSLDVAALHTLLLEGRQKPADGFGVGGEEPDRPEETGRPEEAGRAGDDPAPSADAGGHHADPPPFRTPAPTEVFRERD